MACCLASLTEKVFARTALKKLCNHPKLIYDAMHARTAGGGDSGAGSGKSGGGGPDGFEVRVFACAAKRCCPWLTLFCVDVQVMNGAYWHVCRIQTCLITLTCWQS